MSSCPAIAMQPKYSYRIMELCSSLGSHQRLKEPVVFFFFGVEFVIVLVDRGVSAPAFSEIFII